MSTSSAGRAVSSNGCVTRPKGRENGLHSCAVQIPSSLLIGSYVMETAEQREPYESRGSRTVLGEPGGESPPGHSTSSHLRHSAALSPIASVPAVCRRRCLWAAAAVSSCNKCRAIFLEAWARGRL